MRGIDNFTVAAEGFSASRRASSFLPGPNHDLRHTHASILLKAGAPVKVVSERLSHANPAFTITVYQHIIPGMQADAATAFSNLVAGVLPPTIPASEVVDDE